MRARGGRPPRPRAAPRPRPGRAACACIFIQRVHAVWRIAVARARGGVAVRPRSASLAPDPALSAGAVRCQRSLAAQHARRGRALGTMLSIGARDFEASSTRVDLSGCDLGVGSPAVMRELADALPRMPGLATLDLSHNVLCDGTELSELAGLLPVLAACDSLTSLNLGECGLDASAAVLLADIVVSHERSSAVAAERLCSLSVSGNPRIRDHGMVPLLRSLQHRRVVSLDVSDCGLGPPRCGRA